MLRCDSLMVSYGPVAALRSVGVSVERGETVALLGANGAGKTTLLRTLSGLTRQSAGSIILDARAIERERTYARVKLGLAHVPERRRIFPGLTVLENLKVGASSWRKPGQSCAQDLERVFTLFPRLSERAGQYGWSLSGGEQQMLAIGRALMSRPKVLLLDEPSLGLSPRMADEVYERIDVLSNAGLSVLVVEQNTALALEVATRAYVLEHGAIVLEGSAADIRDNPRTRQAYLGQ
ncbi:ABC transporter ATP-binding protein [Pusillimonas sp.]|uniref:ABC transporter ATP-binding protein n=1 Tax=Pusillimonas sp. TaxID=3040095 RepID=UPI0029B6D239|nr:ABC transporter ATP-binding protein [Pusillimonas sp.]MDX3893858.1 ABC transporter ATP-binding protein [Pusillimonas sp.]